MAGRPGEMETVLITGASAGIGRELSRLFAADGADLVIVARREKRLQCLADELHMDFGTTSIILPVDLSRPNAADEVYGQLQQRGIVVDVLVNNAGMGLRGRFVDCAAGIEVDMIQLNVVSPTRLTRLLLPGMLQRGRGGLLNLASMAAFQPGPQMAVYYATKAYMLSWTEALAEELRGTGVQVTCLAPGPTATELSTSSGFAETRLYQLGAMNPRDVAVAGYIGFRKCRRIVEPDMKSKLGALAVRMLPRRVVRRAVGWLNMPARTPT